MLQTKLVTIQDRPVLLARPQSNQYGHLALEMRVAISRARQLQTDLHFLRDRHAVGPALYDLDTDAVRILRPTTANRARVLLKMAEDWPAAARSRRDQAIDRVKAETVHELKSHVNNPKLHGGLRRSLRRVIADLQQPRPPAPLRPEEAMFADDGYSGRRRLFEPFRAFIREDLVEHTTRQADAIGMTAGMKLVCMHARESGYKAGREAESKGSRRVDATRNARIETYYAAMDYLVECGYTVVRVGDPSMEPVRRRGVIDLATHPLRTGMVELFAMLHSDFIMCGESGPFSVSYLTNTPLAVVNATCPIGGYPVRRDGFCMLKKVVDRRTGRLMRLRDLLDVEYLQRVRDVTRFVYVDNTPEEILAAAQEMVEWLSGRYVETPAQAEFRTLATDAGVRLREQVRYVAKHGPDRGFLGEGRVFRFVADKLL